jgi:hypothetical protein
LCEAGYKSDFGGENAADKPPESTQTLRSPLGDGMTAKSQQLLIRFSPKYFVIIIHSDLVSEQLLTLLTKPLKTALRCVAGPSTASSLVLGSGLEEHIFCQDSVDF